MTDTDVGPDSPGPTRGSDAAENIEDICAVMVCRDPEKFCTNTAVTDIVVSNLFGRYIVPICAEHNQEHREFYRARRSSGHRNRRDRRRVYPNR